MLSAHIGARSARILMVPGTKVYGIRLSVKAPMTRDEDYRYAMIRLVTTTHCSPFGPVRRTWSWAEMMELAACYDMPLVADADNCWPAPNEAACWTPHARVPVQSRVTVVR